MLHRQVFNFIHSYVDIVRIMHGQHLLPAHQKSDALKDIAIKKLETINLFTLALSEKQVETIVNETAAREADTN